MTLPLTEQQERLWRFIGSCERSPSFSEMCGHMGLHSKSGIARLIERLEAKGFIRRYRCLARSIVAVDPRDDLSAYSTATLRAEIERRERI